MIQKPSRLAGFLYIDHCCEGIPWSRPKEDEMFVGIPCGFYDVGSLGCIEVYKKDKLLYSINLADISCIEFMSEEKEKE